MLIPANHPLWEAKKISEWLDPSKYIQTVTSKGISKALDWIEYETNIEVEENTSDLRAEINREIIRLKNQGMTLSEIVYHIIPLIQILIQLSKESELTVDEAEKNNLVIPNAFYAISEDLWIPSNFTYEKKVLKIAELIEKYHNSQNKKATM